MSALEMPSNRVAQASGMVSVQAECSVDEAVAKMQQHARAISQTTEDVADAVLDGRIRFSADEQ